MPHLSPFSQTGSGKGGFLGGFATSLLGGVVNSVQTASTTVKVAMASIAGGTASVLGGGKFSNGAMSGAFIMMFNELANTYPSKDKMKSLSLSGWKYGKNGRYRTWLVDGVDTGESQYAPFEYYNGNAPSEKFFNGIGNYVVRHPDGIGLTLSVGAVVSTGGLSILLGSSAIGIDLLSQDWAGAGIGTFAMMPFNTLKAIDIGYGIDRVLE